MSGVYSNALSRIVDTVVMRPLSLALCAVFGHESVGQSHYNRFDPELIEWRCWRCDALCERESEDERDVRVAGYREGLRRFHEFVSVDGETR